MNFLCCKNVSSAVSSYLFGLYRNPGRYYICYIAEKFWDFRPMLDQCLEFNRPNFSPGSCPLVQIFMSAMQQKIVLRLGHFNNTLCFIAAFCSPIFIAWLVLSMSMKLSIDMCSYPYFRWIWAWSKHFRMQHE